MSLAEREREDAPRDCGEVIPVELVAPAEESSSRLVPEAVAESLRDTIGADQGARRIIGTLDSRVGLKAEKEDMMVVVVDEEQEEEGSHFSRLPSAASVQRYRHETLCPKTTAPPSSSLPGPASAHTVPARKREAAPGLAGARQDNAVWTVSEELMDGPGGVAPGSPCFAMILLRSAMLTAR
ncbi:hypothetical protein LA080_013669 [Diaporthe eres]|nr:hypothetical protein LA080_013669 [Diaporthe eres]